MSLCLSLYVRNHSIDSAYTSTGKDHAIVKEHFNHHSVDKEKELLKNEIAKIKKQIQTSDQIIENQRIELLKLSRIIDEADKERLEHTQTLLRPYSDLTLALYSRTILETHSEHAHKAPIYIQ